MKKEIPTIEEFKSSVQEIFYEQYKKEGLKLGQAYNIEAKKLGFKDWHHLNAFYKGTWKEKA